MQRNFLEKRRKKPSYTVPFFYFSLEGVLMYLLLSLFNWDMNFTTWNFYAYLIALVWLGYSSLKLYFVLKRQKMHYD